MKSFAVALVLLTLSACVADQQAANQICAGSAGSVSRFGDTGYGPVHAQAVAPDSPGPLQPWR